MRAVVHQRNRYCLLALIVLPLRKARTSKSLIRIVDRIIYAQISYVKRYCSENAENSPTLPSCSHVHSNITPNTTVRLLDYGSDQVRTNSLNTVKI